MSTTGTLVTARGNRPLRTRRGSKHRLRYPTRSLLSSTKRSLRGKPAPSLVAVAIRRVLEATAVDQGAPGPNLSMQIRWLATEGKIPHQLAEMMNVSRTLGNLGAHHSEFGFNDDDVTTLIDFTRTLFEYLYVAPAKLEAFRKSVEERKQ